MIHEIPVRVYYEDTDAGGIVYYANYMKFAERGRTEFLRAAGFDHISMRDGEDVLFVVRRLAAEYHRGAELDDLLTVVTEGEAAKGASFAMKQSILKGKVVLFEMTVTLACINKDGRPVRVPERLKQVLA